jgi:hypothetical protein
MNDVSTHPPGGTFVPVLLLMAIREICVTTTGNAKRRTNEVFFVQPTAAEVLNTLSVKIPMPPTSVLSATAELLDGSGRTGMSAETPRMRMRGTCDVTHRKCRSTALRQF